MNTEQRMLTDHRRAFVWSLGLLGCCLASLFLVGRHPPELAPLTTARFIGRFDTTMYRWMADIRNAPLTWISKVLNVVGGGLVTIPVRIGAVLALAIRRRWARCIAFALTWALSEFALSWLKAWFHRGRPPHPLVVTSGYSFPSGHAVAAAATGVALVIAFFAPGARRRWEWIAVAFTFAMAMSRVYLAAHWFSDVVAGVLLGAGIAIFSAATVTECRDLIFRGQHEPVPEDTDPPTDPQVAK
ncbi:MAG TPA: phosphatase PAP2 family protein [Actinomycetota bacterium]|nr:phosphatase PAP2 family protein [Actinomycetota bacterium]